MKDIYGEITGDSTWEDGYFSHFLGKNCVDTLLGDSSSSYVSERSSSVEGVRLQVPSCQQKSHLYQPWMIMILLPLITALWIVFDGEMGATMVLEPTRGFIESTAMVSCVLWSMRVSLHANGSDASAHATIELVAKLMRTQRYWICASDSQRLSSFP